MPVSLSNSKDIVANNISVVKGNTFVDVLGTIDDVKGLAPETLNTLEKLANALNNDSNYFQTVSGAISNKADAATTYTKTDVDTALALKANQSAVADALAIKADQNSLDTTNAALTGVTLLAELDEKQDTLTAGSVQGGFPIMQDGIVRALKAISPAWLAVDVNHLEFGIDLNSYATNAAVALKADQATTYTKTEVDTQFSNFIDSAPDALNTLKELANALGDDANYARTVLTQLATKANTTYVETQVATLNNAIAGKMDSFGVAPGSASSLIEGQLTLLPSALESIASAPAGNARSIFNFLPFTSGTNTSADLRMPLAVKNSSGAQVVVFNELGLGVTGAMEATSKIKSAGIQTTDGEIDMDTTAAVFNVNVGVGGVLDVSNSITCSSITSTNGLGTSGSISCGPLAAGSMSTSGGIVCNSITFNSDQNGLRTTSDIPVSIFNTTGSMVAQFRDDYTTTLNGNTYVTDNLYVSGECHASQYLRSNTGVATNTIIGNGANEITIADNLVVTGDLTVQGSINYNPFWVSSRVNGSTLQVLKSNGKYGFTVTRPADFPTGVYGIAFDTPAPDANYVISLAQIGNGNIKVWEATLYGGPPTTTRFHVVTYNTSWQLVNYEFYFSVFV
jgi:hypothetical protein